MKHAARKIFVAPRLQSLAEQITLARQALSTAEEVVRLTRERKQFAVGAVLEDIQAQQDFLRARLDYLNTVTEFNKVQSELQKNLGGSSGVSAGRVIQN